MLTHVSLTLDSDFLHIPTLASATTAIDSVCPECGMAKKYGKSSCCGRGGSWFGKCGSVGDANLGYTWYEGIRACKARQIQAAVGQDLRVSQSQRNMSFDDAVAGLHSNAAIVASHVSVSSPANTSTPLAVTTQTRTIPARTWMAYDRRTTYKEIGATIATMMHTSASTLTPKPTKVPEHLTIDLANAATVPSMASASTDMSRKTSRHKSAGRTFTVRDCAKLLHLIICIGTILDIVSW